MDGDVVHVTMYGFNCCLSICVLTVLIKETKSVYFKNAKYLLKLGSFINIFCLSFLICLQIIMLVYIKIYNNQNNDGNGNIRNNITNILNYVLQSICHVQTLIYCIATVLRLKYIFQYSPYSLKIIEIGILIGIQIVIQLAREVGEIIFCVDVSIYNEFQMKYTAMGLFGMTILVELYTIFKYIFKLQLLVKTAGNHTEWIYSVSDIISKTVIITLFNILLYLIFIGIMFYIGNSNWISYFINSWFVIGFPLSYNLVFINIDKIEFDDRICCCVCKCFQRCFVNKLITTQNISINSNNDMTYNQISISSKKLNDIITSSYDSFDNI